MIYLGTACCKEVRIYQLCVAVARLFEGPSEGTGTRGTSQR